MRSELDPQIDSILKAIQSAVVSVNPEQSFGTAKDSVNLMSQGDRMIDYFENWLLDDEQQQALVAAPQIRFSLYAAAYLCDIGLTEGKSAWPAGESFSGNLNTEALLAALDKRSADLIRSDWHRLGIRDSQSADVIADVCIRASAKAGATGSGLTSTGSPEGYNDLAAACLQLGRALDLDSTAAMLQIHSRLSGGCEYSIAHLSRCFKVEEIGSHPYLNATIRVKIRCDDAEVHRALKHHERYLQRVLEGLNRRVRPRFLYSDVLYEIQPQGYKPIDLKFSIDSSAGLQLFMGNRLYADKRVFLRELIQNAVDACNYRKLMDATYSPAITIEFNADVSSISIRDNGIGMTRQWIEKYFLAIGISFYQSDEIRNAGRDAHIDFGFISQFGIGFLSSFQVADRIVIKTCKQSNPGLVIAVDSLRDYFDVHVLDEEMAVGTEVTLHLKKSEINYCRRLEFAGYLKTNIRFLNIPVTLRDKGGRTLTIGREVMAYPTGKSAGKVFVAALNMPESEGYVRLSAKNNGTHIYALESASGGVSVFQDGIFVTQLDDLLPEGARSYVVARINLMGRDKCELSMDRNRIFWTSEQFQNLKKAIRHSLVAVANQLMAALVGQDVSVNTLNSVVNHLAIFFDFSEVDDHMYHQMCVPVRDVVEKRFRDFVRINFAHTLRANGITEADDYSESWQQQVLESFIKS